MLGEAKRLDRSFASHSLRETPERDLANAMDFIETNEYGLDIRTQDKHLEHLAPDLSRKGNRDLGVRRLRLYAGTPRGDERRIEILRTHDAVIRSKHFVGNAIFFCYNDYRTHHG